VTTAAFMVLAAGADELGEVMDLPGGVTSDAPSRATTATLLNTGIHRLALLHLPINP
jgi:hypothetical protein